MPRINLLRTASFRLAALYLALFAASTVALGVFVYWSIRHEILADFDEAIVEERGALQQIFAKDGRDRLVGALDARAASGGRLAAGLWGPDGRRLGGDLALPPSSLPPKGGWFDAREAEADEAPESEPETLRALATPLPDGSTLVVANERRRSDETLRRVMTAFAWALGGTIALGAPGGLWLSAQFLRCIDVMRRAARGIMAGDWSRRIPLASACWPRLSGSSAGGRLGGRRGDRQGGARVAARAFCRIRTAFRRRIFAVGHATGLIQVGELSRLSSNKRLVPGPRRCALFHPVGGCTFPARATTDRVAAGRNRVV